MTHLFRAQLFFLPRTVPCGLGKQLSQISGTLSIRLKSGQTLGDGINKFPSFIIKPFPHGGVSDLSYVQIIVDGAWKKENGWMEWAQWGGWVGGFGCIQRGRTHSNTFSSFMLFLLTIIHRNSGNPICD